MKEEKEDYFDHIPEDRPEKPKEPKKPALKPDDPLYYEQEESRWEHLIPSPYRRNRLLWGILGVLVVVSLFFLVYVYFFTPEVDQAVEYGYVDNIRREKTGLVFNSYEGRILPYKSIMDTVRPYEGDFVFSVKNVDVATKIKRQQASGTPVRLEYEIYRQRLPWRGKTKILVTAVDSVNPDILLPPDRRPKKN